MKKIKYIIASLLVVLFVGSCTEGWEDLNSDPNNPVDVPAMNILTYVERYSCNFLYDITEAEYSASFAHHTGKIQYIDESRYEFREGHINGDWNSHMYAQLDIKKIIEKAQEAGNTNLEAIAMTMSAFLWQKMTDTWGAVPFTEGAQGEDGIIQPQYDSQETVYNGLLTMLEDANTKFAANTGIVTDADILLGGDIAWWRKFANSLHLRVAIRMSDVDETAASAEISKILDDPATYPILESNADMVALKWDGSAWREPWMANSTGRDDHAIAKTIVDFMLDLNDPRLPEYAHPAASDGQYRGVVVGIAEANEGDFQLNEISRIGERYRDDPTGLSYMMRYAEVEFLKAEAYERGLATGDAQAAYEAGITAAMEEHGVAAADITAYMANADVAWDDNTGTLGYTNLQKIYFQKWFSLFKQGHEAWAETRRTDVPQLPHAPGSPYLGNGYDRPPFRWPYPSNESTYNEDVVNQWNTGIVDFFWGEQMWWDTRSLK